MTSPALEKMAKRFEDVTWEVSHGQEVAGVPAHSWYTFAATALEEGFEVCVDVTAVDWMRQRPDRFELVANLLSMSQSTRLRMITTLGRDDPHRRLPDPALARGRVCRT